MHLFIHSGCGSHKLMNIFKHGTVTMHASWPEGDGPALLFNKDNQAVMDDVDGKNDPRYGDAQQRAVNTAQGGGIKLTTVAGLVFNHPDSKKGYSEQRRTWMKMKVGNSCPFETSNCRFGSHGNAASELITNLEAYIEFLHMVRDAKDSMNYTNMESNVEKGL